MSTRNSFPDKPVSTKAAVVILILSLFFALNGLSSPKDIGSRAAASIAMLLR